jgi:hypothetical protein
MEMTLLLDYCASDVYACRDLWSRMLEGWRQYPSLRIFHPQEILFRGRFMIALARSNRVGVPVDAPFLRDVMTYSDETSLAIATKAEKDAEKAAEATAHLADGDRNKRYHWGIYDGAALRMKGYEDFLQRADINVPRTTKTNKPTTSPKALEKLEGRYPGLAPLRECIHNLDALDALDIEIDTDDRVRMFTRPFGAITSRSTKSFFTYPKFLRPAIKPPRGWAVQYLDAKAQEHLIAAAESGDQRMLADYFKGDVHQQLVEELALTEEGGKKPRERAKIINHATSYGQGKWGLAGRLGTNEDNADEILRGHKRGRARFYRWRQSIVNGLRHTPRRTFFTRLGWPFWTGGVSNDRTMMNFPAQSGGADWMRIVMIAGTEAGVLICLSAHDGFLIIAPEDRIDHDTEIMRQIMIAASEVLFGYPMLVDCGEDGRAVWPHRLVIGGELPATWKLINRELRKVKARMAKEAARSSRPERNGSGARQCAGRRTYRARGRPKSPMKSRARRRCRRFRLMLSSRRVIGCPLMIRKALRSRRSTGTASSTKHGR